MSRTVATCGVLLVCLVMIASCQTFQYSRGWTNGKRRDGAIVAGPSRVTVEHRLLEEFLSKFAPKDRVVLERLGHLFRTLDRSEDDQEY
ncbi:pro-corazonin isoform X2 [Dermacentor albipictus]